MIKLLAVLLLSSALFLGAKPVSAAPSISLVESDPHLGGVVHFNWDDGGLHGNKNPRIQVVCVQDVPFDYTWPDGSVHTQTDPVVYGEAKDAQGNVFTLGGGLSVWLMHGGGADCVATLYYWGNQGSFNPLAEVIFHAEG